MAHTYHDMIIMAEKLCNSHKCNREACVRVRNDLISRIESCDEKMSNDINNGDSEIQEIMWCVRNDLKIISSMKMKEEETMDMKCLISLLSKINWMIEKYDIVCIWLHIHGYDMKDLNLETEHLNREDIEHKKRTLDERTKGMIDIIKNNTELVGSNQDKKFHILWEGEYIYFLRINLGKVNDDIHIDTLDLLFSWAT